VRLARGAAREPSIAFVCDRCEKPIYRAIDGPAGEAGCPGCGAPHVLRLDDRVLQSRQVIRCLRCGQERLYTQKDFNRRIGLGVFAVAALLSVPTWGLSLLAATLVDVGLYYLLGDVTICYACGAQHRGLLRNPAHGPFDLHVAETIDRQPRAV